MNIKLDYKPRYYQQVLHASVKRFNVIVCHRRFGKTVWSTNEIIDRAIHTEHKQPQFAYIAPNYGQAKRVAWDMFKQFTSVFPNRKIYEQELRIDIPITDDRKIRMMLLGAENPDSLRGLYLHGAVLDEYASMYSNVWTEVVRPALSDHQGWAHFVGTPKGSNHFKDIYDQATGKENWFRAIYKASETGVIPEEELRAALEDMPEEEYLQEYECDFGAALIGAYYGKEMRRARNEFRITRVPYDTGFPVITAWDLGINDSMSIWFLQFVGREIRVLEYYENSGEGLGHYVDYIKSRPYSYEVHLLPHDAEARELGTGVTRQETLRNLGLGRTQVVPKQNLMDGINATRNVIGRCWFDEQRCIQGIKCLENYQKKWDSKTKVFRNTPLHDWASHGADAFRTFAQSRVSVNGPVTQKQVDLPRESEHEFNIFGG